MSEQGKIVKIAGPLIVAENVEGSRMFDVVKVGELGLTGEIIEMRDNLSWVQVYEETGGIKVGEPVVTTGVPLSLTLGPGLMSSFYDGIQRPLDTLAEETGIYITRGVDVPSLDEKKEWEFKPTAQVGYKVSGGDVLGEVDETELVTHKVMVPPLISGTLKKLEKGKHTVVDTIAVIEDEDGNSHEVQMAQKWPIRNPRPVNQKLLPTEPLVTGQRIVDTLFPVMKGGAANVPGPFGSGKTVVQHQLAKWADADIIVYVGCGERGNEMTDVVKEFPHLIDPKSGKPLMDRTVLIANTSNMPIAAREASVYTGITIAEYFRDMGYNVAMMADSTSRWAEALREMSGRLEEMPGEEGYPAYLASRIAQYYERAGYVDCLGSDERKGSLTVVGAISPPGGDLSEPVSQSSLRVTKVFWALDGSLAYARHYPAINWLTSYSLYQEDIDAYNREHVDPELPDIRKESMRILQKEAELVEIIRIVGMDSLSNEERVLLDTAKSLREDFLQQNAFDDIDTYASLKKQGLMLRIILSFHAEALAICKAVPDVDVEEIFNNELKEAIAGMKFITEDNLDEMQKLLDSIPSRLRNEVDTLEADEAENKPDLHKAVSGLESLEEMDKD